MNKKFKKQYIFMILSLILLVSNIFFPLNSYVCFAQYEEQIYSILDENSIYINSSYDCQVGDMFISEDNLLYEIFQVSNETFIAYARSLGLCEKSASISKI